MPLCPRWVARGGGSGVGKLGADGGQIAGNAVGKDSPGSFDGDVFTLLFKGFSEIGEGRGNHGFSSSEDNVIAVPLGDLFKNFRNRHFWSFRLPGCVWGIAPVTTKVAAGGTNEDGGNTRQKALSLNRVKDLRDSHRFSFSG